MFHGGSEILLKFYLSISVQILLSFESDFVEVDFEIRKIEYWNSEPFWTTIKSAGGTL